jgi:hypothetical protein
MLTGDADDTCCRFANFAFSDISISSTAGRGDGLASTEYGLMRDEGCGIVISRIVARFASPKVLWEGAQGNVETKIKKYYLFPLVSRCPNLGPLSDVMIIMPSALGTMTKIL